MLLSDGYLANGSEPWQLPDVDALPLIDPDFATGPNTVIEDGSETFRPYVRDEETLARPWAIPGTAGLEHRIGGIEKADLTGDISYDPANHEHMVRTRQAKIDAVAASLEPLEVDGPIGAGARRLRREGLSVAQAHLRHLNPFPNDLGEVLARYDTVLVPEMNLGYGFGGQLALLLRAKYLVDVVSFSKVRGQPFGAEEMADAIRGLVDTDATNTLKTAEEARS
jgi:2-oxoglutarate ferredoxin oxidoreductase subunit alpha